MNLKDIINPKYLKKEIILQKREDFQISPENPVGHIIFKDFIKPDIYKKILENIKKSGYTIVEDHSKQGVGKKSIVSQNSFLNEIYGVFESKELEKYISLFFKERVIRYFYTGGDTFVGQLYEKGDFLDWHIDGDTSILGSFVYYIFNQDNHIFDEKSGGHIELGIAKNYENTGGYYHNIECYKKVPISQNTLSLMINNRDSFHRVPKILVENKRIIFHCSLVSDTQSLI